MAPAAKPQATRTAAAMSPARRSSSFMTAPVLPAESTEPDETAERAEPNEAADATANAEAAEPTEPNDRTEPTDPIDRKEPFDAMDRYESWLAMLRVSRSNVIAFSFSRPGEGHSGVMADRQTFKQGDKVTWNTPQGKTHGKVVKKLTSETHVEGTKISASRDDPRYLVESETTGEEAAHKPDALEPRS